MTLNRPHNGHYLVSFHLKLSQLR